MDIMFFCVAKLFHGDMTSGNKQKKSLCFLTKKKQRENPAKLRPPPLIGALSDEMASSSFSGER